MEAKRKEGTRKFQLFLPALKQAKGKSNGRRDKNPTVLLQEKDGEKERSFHFHSCAPLLPHPKTFSMEASAAVRTLWKAALLFSKTCPASTNSSVSLTFQAQKTRSSGNSVATDGNAACGFHTLAVWTSQQVAAFRPDPKLLTEQKWGWQDPPLHQYPIFPKSPNQRLPFSHSNAFSQKAFQKEASAILPKATNTVGLAAT